MGVMFAFQRTGGGGGGGKYSYPTLLNGTFEVGPVLNC